jgi:DNA-binding SARP family transcriptional activator
VRLIVRAVAQATGADVAELVLLDRRPGEPRLAVRQSLDPGDERHYESLLNHRNVLDLAVRNDGAVTICRLPPGSPRDASWYLAIPLSAGGATLGVLSIGSRRTGFPVGLAARILLAIGCQLGAFLGWASSTEQPGLMESIGAHRRNAAALCFHCFGRFRILANGQEIPSRSFARQKSLAVLKVLVAHRGRPLHREWLVEYLWPDADPTLGSNNLRVVLHDLRRAIEPSLRKGQPSTFILTQGDLLYLDPSERCWVDVEEFDRLSRKFDALLDQGRVDDALAVGREAVALPGGEYMEDEPYLDWCIAERERLREVRINLLQRMAAIYAERNQLDAAIAACRQALAMDSLREDLHSRLMDLLGRAGRREEALRQYEICRSVLQQELGVAPDEETWNIYRSIRDQPRRLTRI